MRFVQSWLSILAVLVLLISLYRFVEGFQNWQKSRQIKQHYVAKLAKLERERDYLRIRVENLKTNELAKERLARRLGYIKPGETVYKIVQSLEPQYR